MMQSTSWITILKSIPSPIHEKLVLITAAGTEINLQGILRIERDYLVIKGRLAASTESGRVFFLPFDQLDHIGFREGMSESEILAMFGPAANGQLSPAGAQPATPKNETVDAEPGMETQPGQAAANESSPLMTRPPQVAKAALLERLRRSRTGPESPKPPAR